MRSETVSLENRLKKAHYRISSLEESNAALLKLIENIKSLGDFQERIGLCHDTEMILQISLRQLDDLLEINTGAIFLLDEKTYEFTYKLGLSPSDRPVCQTEMNFQIDKGMIAWALNEGKTAIVESITADQYKQGFTSNKTVLIFPLLTSQKILGIILLVSPLDIEVIKQENMELFSTITKQISLAIENNLLYEDLKKSRDETIEANKEINKFNRTLEKKVEERTEELTRVNEQIQEVNRELTEANHRIKEADRLKSEFLANMSHELRTPLHAIIGFSELLLDGASGQINKDQGQCLKDIFDSGKHLLELINDILDLSKVEAGKIELHYVWFNLEDLVTTVITSISSLIEAKKQKVNIEIKPEISQIYADNERLKQVLINLMSNAIKFTPQGKQITITAEEDDNKFIISVLDEGIGITEKDQKVIFDAFRQADGSHSRKYEGTGLGLALCKKFIEMHQGEIWVESKIDQGSKFCFTLPKDKQ